MLRRFLVATAFVLLAATSALADTWTIDSDDSGASFAARNQTVTWVRGFFHKVTGTVEFDSQDITKAAVNATIDATTIDTGVAARDQHLRSADFFEVDKFPTITFKSKRAEPVAEGKFRLIGDLTIKGVTKEVVLMVEGPSPVVTLGKGVRASGALATTTINRKEFGVNGSPTGVADRVDITIDIEMQQKNPGS